MRSVPVRQFMVEIVGNDVPGGVQGPGHSVIL